MNPWLKKKVKEYRSAHRKEKYTPDSDFQFIIKVLKKAIDADSFLIQHRNKMDLPVEVKKWLYWNNVDRIIDLVQMSEEELRAISVGENDYYDLLVRYLSEHGHSLLHCADRTYKIASTSPLMADFPERLDYWTVNPPGTVHVFNPGRPTTDPEWFDRFYNRYEHNKDEDKVLDRLIPVTAGITYSDVDEFNEYFMTLADIWDVYRDVCKHFGIIPNDQKYRIPSKSTDLMSFPLSRFIDHKKDLLKAIISAFEETSIYYNCSLYDFFEANDKNKLDIAELETDEKLQLILIDYVRFHIDYENVIAYVEEDFDIKRKPSKNWHLNTWLQELIMEYRKTYTEDELRGQYRVVGEYRRSMTWMDFLIGQTLSKAIENNPALLKPIDDTDLDADIKNVLKRYDVIILADLVQMTDTDLNILFDYDRSKMLEICSCLEQNGLYLCHADTMTFRIPVPLDS